jgi:hypothetical protein
MVVLKNMIPATEHRQKEMRDVQAS